MIRALVFDFDGLILDTESSLIGAYEDVYRAHGHPFDRDLFHRSVGVADYSFDPWQVFGKDIDRAALDAKRRARNRERDLLLPILPGAAELIDEGVAQGLKLGLASNSTHPHVEGHLARLGLLDRFTFIACREDVPSPKPEPDMYRLVLNRFGLRGHEAIAFEDSNTGSTAAKRAGLWVVAAPNPSTRHHDFSHVDRVVDALSEISLPQLLKELGRS